MNSQKNASLRRLRSRTFIIMLMCMLLLTLIISACGGNSSTTSNDQLAKVTPNAPAPKDLQTAGTLTIGTDPTYFPMEYVDQTSNQYTGFDIDLSQALAAHMGVKVNVVKTSFDTIFDDLNNKRFDIIVSSVYMSPKRLTKFDFVKYMQAGSALLVQNGNPKNIKGVDDLCGLNVSVQNGTSQQEKLTATSKACEAKGKSAIKVMVLGTETDVIQALVDRRVDATFQGSLSAGYYNKLHPEQFAYGGPVIEAAPSGIVIRKGDAEMQNAVQKAFQALKADGTYDKLFTKWGFTNDEKI